MQFKPSIRYLLLSILALAVIVQAVFLALPTLVETLIYRQLPQHLPQGVLSDLGFKIEKIGLHHALVTRIHLGQGLSADLVDLKYNLKNLNHFQLEQVTVSGLNISARMDAKNQLLFNGAVFLPRTKEPPGESDPINLDSFADFLPRQMVVENAVLSVFTPDQSLLLPFDVQASLHTQQDSQKKNFILKARFHPFGQTIKTVVSGDLNSGVQSMKLEAHSFHLETLSGFFPASQVRFSGTTDIDLLKTPDTDWQLSLSRLQADVPNFPYARIQNFTAAVGTNSVEAGNLTAQGGFDVAGLPVSPMTMAFDLKLNLEKGGAPLFDLTLKNKEEKDFELGFYQVNITQPNFLFSLKGDLIRQTGVFLFDSGNLNAAFDQEKLSVKNILVKSEIKGDFTDAGDGLFFDIHSELSQITLASKLDQARFEAATLTGSVQVTKSLDPLVHLDARIKNGTLKSPGFKVAASGINGRIPFVFPFKKKEDTGEFSIQKIVYDNKVTAALKGTLAQTGPLGIQGKGAVSLEGLDGFNLRFDGFANGGADPHAKIDFKTDPFVLVPGQVRKFVPNLSVSADSALPFSSKGTIEYKENNLKTQASVLVEAGHISFASMTLSGINGAVEFNDLVLPESLPGQVVTIDKIQTGQVEMEKARVQFSIEDGKSVNIENLRFNWCNGIVSTESFRLPAKDKILSLILYCDRLELATLLKQMGAFHAEGEGALSGRIPVVYSDGNISFNKGFLFSTPGQGGRVVIENSQDLIAGIPMDTPEFAQLDLAREALKDFDYTWAKLELNTQKETLTMNMELDGKPAKLLPFEYQKELGSFVRVDATSPGSRFQGIKLNVNLKLPFNQVLKFGNKIKTMFD